MTAAQDELLALAARFDQEADALRRAATAARDRASELAPPESVVEDAGDTQPREERNCVGGSSERAWAPVHQAPFRARARIGFTAGRLP